RRRGRRLGGERTGARPAGAGRPGRRQRCRVRSPALVDRAVLRPPVVAAAGITELEVVLLEVRRDAGLDVELGAVVRLEEPGRRLGFFTLLGQVLEGVAGLHRVLPALGGLPPAE